MNMGVIDVLRGALESVLDSIIPPRARAMRTKARLLEDIPLYPTAHEMLGEKIVTIMDYRNSAVQDLIRSLKYDGSGAAAVLAAAALSDYLREEVADEKSFSPREILLVPIPLHRSRARERGFNQIEIVLKALPQEFKDGTLSTLAPRALERMRETKSQTHLSRAERLNNVADAFAAADEQKIYGAHIFLIDDVTTTGATLVSAGKTLERSGAKVSLLALARA